MTSMVGGNYHDSRRRRALITCRPFDAAWNAAAQRPLAAEAVADAARAQVPEAAVDRVVVGEDSAAADIEGSVLVVPKAPGRAMLSLTPTFTEWGFLSSAWMDRSVR